MNNKNNNTTTNTYMVIKLIIEHTINIFILTILIITVIIIINKSNLQDIMKMMDIKLVMENAKWHV